MTEKTYKGEIMKLSTLNAQLIINTFGRSYSRNECALTVKCHDNNGIPFEVIQFSDGYAFISQTCNKTEPYEPINICI